MKINFRNYNNDHRFGSDYYKVWDFLKRINQDEVITPNFLWARWTWMISRPVDNEIQRNQIGIWEDNETIVAIATFELTFGEVFICIDKDYKFLMQEIISYAKERLLSNGRLKIIINDNDKELQSIAASNGLRPTQKKQSVSKLDITNELSYQLPKGFSIVSMADDWSYSQYNRVMWRGFNHEGEPGQTDEDIEWRRTMLSSPHLVPELIIAIVAPSGEYVAHCGIWHHPNDTYAYVEPVATDPEYRKMGLAKAAIYEALLRTQKAGAKVAYVVSSQQFYYNIGFKPDVTETWWELF